MVGEDWTAITLSNSFGVRENFPMGITPNNPKLIDSLSPRLNPISPEEEIDCFHCSASIYRYTIEP